jgi:hypothetical protein
VRGDVPVDRCDNPVDSETLLVTDFVNLKIKPAQSFRSAYRGRVCVRVFIGVSTHTCISICICTVFLKKEEAQAVSAKLLLGAKWVNTLNRNDSWFKDLDRLTLEP